MNKDNEYRENAAECERMARERLLGYANVEPYPAKCAYRSCRGLCGPRARIRRHSRGIRRPCSCEAS